MSNSNIRLKSSTLTRAANQHFTLFLRAHELLNSDRSKSHGGQRLMEAHSVSPLIHGRLCLWCFPEYLPKCSSASNTIMFLFKRLHMRVRTITTMHTHFIRRPSAQERTHIHTRPSSPSHRGKHKNKQVLTHMHTKAAIVVVA